MQLERIFDCRVIMEGHPEIMACSDDLQVIECGCDNEHEICRGLSSFSHGAGDFDGFTEPSRYGYQP